MAIITVDLEALLKAASEMEQSAQAAYGLLHRMDGEMLSLGASWQGADASAFLSQWHSVSGPAETGKEILEGLLRSAELLRFSFREYQRAQAASLRRAQALDRLF